MEARDIYLSLLRLQYRYNTVVTQLFSDGGTNLKAKLLGSRKGFYQEKLESLWGVFNNTPYSQHRNLVERKVSMLKRMIKEGVFGMPGKQAEAVDRSMLETTILAATNMVNNTPYMECGPNQHLVRLFFWSRYLKSASYICKLISIIQVFNPFVTIDVP